jgi:hypothetical protein
MKRLEKEKEFSNSYSAMGQNLAGRRAWPGQPLHSTPPLSVSAQPMKRPTRPSRPIFFPPRRDPPGPSSHTLPVPGIFPRPDSGYGQPGRLTHAESDTREVLPPSSFITYLTRSVRFWHEIKLVSVSSTGWYRTPFK